MQVAESKPDRQANPLGPRCTVCDHDDIDAINVELAAGAKSYRSIAQQFGLSPDATYRHQSQHLPRKLTKAQQRIAEQVEDAFVAGLKRTARRCDKGLLHALEALEATGEDSLPPDLIYRMGPAYAAQASRARELIGQATGRLGQAQNAAGGINVNLQIVIPRAIEAGPAQVPAIDVQAIEPGDTPSE